MKKSSTKEFIEKARKVHGDRYTYENSIYTGRHSKITITCAKHGDFDTDAGVFLSGSNCPRCSCEANGDRKRSSIKQFIEKAEKVHGNKYDYSLTEYKSSQSKVRIICKVHGVFEQTPAHHLRGEGCPICAGTMRSNTEKFIEEAKKVHGDKFDYSLVDYKNCETKVKVICKVHGVFEQIPKGHLIGKGCPKCKIEKFKLTNLSRYNTEYPMQNTKIKEKSKQTCLERYGVEHSMQSPDIRYKAIKTFLEKYGVEIPMKSPLVVEKSRQTCLEKYGVNNSMKSFAVREKVKQTLIERYGVDNPLKSSEIQDKIKHTCIERYGVEIPMKSPLVVEKSKQTCIERYGVDNPLKSSEIRDKIKQTCLEKYGVDNTLKIPEVYAKTKHSRDANDKEHRYSSKAELEILEYIKSIGFPDAKKGWINGKEVDIYIPEKQVAVEYNGLYWHSEAQGKGINYHKEKTDVCRASGVRLIHIFEDQWRDKQEICKSIIASALGIYKQRIFARKCEIREISRLVYNAMLNENHIQGQEAHTPKKMLGLFFNNELVQCMGFGISNSNSKEMELTRMVTKKFTQVIGGFSRLVKASGLTDFISYVDCSIFDGNGYSAVGFTEVEHQKPAYFYFDAHSQNPVRLHRRLFQKKHLEKKFADFNWNETEHECCLRNGFLRIYDAGKIKLHFSMK